MKGWGRQGERSITSIAELPSGPLINCRGQGVACLIQRTAGLSNHCVLKAVVFLARPLAPHPYFSLRFAACSAESSHHSLETTVDSWVLELVCKAVKVVLQLVKAPF